MWAAMPRWPQLHLILGRKRCCRCVPLCSGSKAMQHVCSLMQVMLVPSGHMRIHTEDSPPRHPPPPTTTNPCACAHWRQGWNGSGTIFFSMCNLRCGEGVATQQHDRGLGVKWMGWAGGFREGGECPAYGRCLGAADPCGTAAAGPSPSLSVFCQNWDISHHRKGFELTAEASGAGTLPLTRCPGHSGPGARAATACGAPGWHMLCLAMAVLWAAKQVRTPPCRFLRSQQGKGAKRAQTRAGFHHTQAAWLLCL